MTKRWTVGALTGVRENGEQAWTERDFWTRQAARSTARTVSRECGTAMVADGKSGGPVALFRWGREYEVEA